jgi:hypothetical protein
MPHTNWPFPQQPRLTTKTQPESDEPLNTFQSAYTSKSAMSVSALAVQCDKLLAEAQSDRTLSSALRLDPTNLLTRFRIWAGNIGAFAPGNASVDYRLRDDDDVACIFISMLNAPEVAIARAVNPPLLEEDEESDETDRSILGSTESSSSSS